MTKRMLLDAAHEEETRVAILDGERLQDFDFESAAKRQLKGNIYLAKIVKIEPSLQAAFIDYGGERHGFLPFSEIHPDYYRIPIEDREAILREQAEMLLYKKQQADGPLDEVGVGHANMQESTDFESSVVASDFATPDVVVAPADIEIIDFSPEENGSVVPGAVVAVEKAEESAPLARKRFVPLHKRYKIQEVITSRQILLVQVTKEARGSKGASLTTYLSLPGRYCVLMPNSPNSGGVSRKITNVSDRKRLKVIVDDIKLPESMSLIVRTAGASRTKVEIKRDSEYLQKLWNDIRDCTMQSIAPSMVYEEGDLIKRALRDYYDKDISEVIIQGNKAYESARVMMKQLMPTHLKKIKEYSSESMPIFQRYGVENQLSGIYDPVVRLRSGGYIVFGTTEALVAIDVNSGRATRERHIDDTALKTNLEAAEEVARQLRLRDLAGLVVIDFIDMDDPRHIDAVERRMRDAMRFDKARTQIGRISQFGLMELSRQRLRPNIIEASSLQCSHCSGTGMVRSVSSLTLEILRRIEEECARNRSAAVEVSVDSLVAVYILNEKREAISEIETRLGVKLRIQAKHDGKESDYSIATLEIKPRSVKAVQPEKSQKNTPLNPEMQPSEPEVLEGDELQKRNKKRKRSRRRTKDRDTIVNPLEIKGDSTQTNDAEKEKSSPEVNNTSVLGADGESAKKDRRDRRGLRRRRRRGPGNGNVASNEEGASSPVVAASENRSPIAEEKPKKEISSNSKPKEDVSHNVVAVKKEAEPAVKKQATAAEKTSKKGWLKRLLES